MSSNIKQFLTGIALEPLSADPSNPVEGQLQRSDGTVRSKGVWEYKDGSWQELGSGAGSLDIVGQETFKNTVVADFEDGNSSTFLDACAGALVGSLSDETSSPIKGDSSAKYTQASSGSTNDFFVLPAFTLSEKEQQNFLGISFYYTYNGADNDIKFVIYDASNNEVLSDSTELLKLTSKSTRYSTSVYIPDGVTSLKIGFQVLSDSNAAVLVIDEFELSSNPFTYAQLEEIGEWTTFTPSFNNMGTVTNANGKYRRVGDSVEVMCSCTTGTVGSAPFGVDLPASLTLDSSKVTISNDTSNPGTQVGSARQDGGAGRTFGVVTAPSTSTSAVYLGGNEAGLGHLTPSSGSIGNSDVISFHYIVPVSGWKSSAEYVVTPAKSTVNTYTALLNGAAGTFDTSAIISQNADFISSVSRGATGTYTINFNSGLFTVAPSVRISAHGGQNRNAGNDVPTTSSVTCYTVVTTSGALENNYFSIEVTPDEADLTPANFLAAVPTQLTAIVKDVKSTGTSGGTFTSGAWRTRDLNTVEGDSSFISLSSNQFTLPAGKYVVEAVVPAYKCDGHKAMLYDITSSTVKKMGSPAWASSPNDGSSSSFINDVIEITGSNTYEIRHQCVTTQATSGFGVAGGFSEEEVYAQVKITKIK